MHSHLVGGMLEECQELNKNAVLCSHIWNPIRLNAIDPYTITRCYYSVGLRIILIKHKVISLFIFLITKLTEYLAGWSEVVAA